MAVDKYLDQIDDMLEEAWSLPLTGGKRLVDIDKIRELVDQIRLNLPQEIHDAKAIVKDREEIIADARAEAESIIQRAEGKARALVSQEEILKSAEAKATEVTVEANQKAKAAERKIIDYSEEMLKKTEAALLAAYNEVKETRGALRGKPVAKAPVQQTENAGQQ